VAKLNKKVLIHSIVFSPDCVSTAYLYNDIAIGLKKNGFDVIVLTTTPHYNVLESELKKQPINKKLLGLYFMSNFNGIPVYHIPLKKNKSTLLRIIKFIYWHVVSLLFSLSFKRIDIVISPSPPLTIGLISIIIGKIKRAKTVYNIQEIYPDYLVQQGIIKNKLIIGLLSKLETFVYNKSDRLITIDEQFFEIIKNRLKDKSKISVIPNFVDTDIYKPLNVSDNLIAEQKVNSKTILMYAGNIGFFQDWDPIIYAAEGLKTEDVEFWIFGEGKYKDSLEKEILKRGILNIRIFPYLDRISIVKKMNEADIHFISVNSSIENTGFPSKIFTIMACRKPMIIVVGEATPMAKFFQKTECGIVISDNRNQNFLEKIMEMKNNKKLRENLAINGYDHVISNYTKDIVIGKFIQEVVDLDC
jgi:colanic acid biosynthesis glycosyl transferase WcaI